MVEPLGAQLCAAGVVTQAEVADANPAHAGTPTRFARRLLSDALHEAALAGFFVSRGAGPVVRKSEFESVPSSVSGALRGEMARALCALPVALHGDELEVAMLVPWDEHAIHEIRRATGRQVRPRAALLTELLAAVERCHPLTNVARRSAPEPDEPVLELVQRRRSPEERVNRADGDDALPLVRKKAVKTQVSPPHRTFERPREARAPTFRGSETAEYQSSDLAPPPEPTPEPTPEPEPTPPPEATPPASLSASAAASLPSVDKLAATANVRTRGTKRQVPDAAVPTRKEPHPLDSWGPLSESKPPPARTREARTIPDVGPALAALREADDRDALIRAATGAAALVARGAVLLAVRRDVLKGWDGEGPGVSPEAIRNLWIPVHSPGVMRQVVERGEGYRGPHGDSAADQLFRAAIAGSDGTLVVEPVRVASRVVALICADDVHYQEAGAERIAVLAQATAKGLERLLRQKKRGAGGSK